MWQAKSQVFADVAVNFADVIVDFCLPRQQKGVNQKKKITRVISRKKFTRVTQNSPGVKAY
jgi:hypothetical protein